MSKGTGIPQAESTLIDGVISRIYNTLNEQDSYIDAIQKKLHLIKNKVKPEDQGVPPDAKFDDVAGRLNHELQRLSNHNNRLQSIINHLSEII